MRAAIFTALFAVTAVSQVAAQEPMRFGIDATAAPLATSKGLSMAYGSVWAGAWNQKFGWGGVEEQLRTAKANGLTPVIQWWYWGDDISPVCVEQGCMDRYQGIRKDKATWYRLSTELADVVTRVYGNNSGAVVIIETEFNKAGIENYEAFDGYLADHAGIFHARGQKVVVGFGNWGQSSWRNFDRAVAASDYLGIQVLYSSIREANIYLDGVDVLINGAMTLKTMFNKPTFVTDFAFSSYPEPNYETHQDAVVREIFARMDELKAAGVRGMVWRMLKDDATFDTSNYHGMAERFWGLLHSNGSEKKAFASFLNGVRAEAGGVGTPAPAPAPAPIAVPSAPVGLSAASSSQQVTLTWTAVAGAASYTLKASVNSGGPFTAIAGAVSAPTFTHGGLVNGSTYYYVVSATNSAGEGVNSAQVTGKPVAPPVAPAANINVWWPTDKGVLTGLQPFKALLEGSALSTYRMYWQVDGGQLNLMGDSQVDYPHKEVAVNVAGWNWKGNGPYAITFVAKNLSGAVVGQRTVTVFIK